MASLRIHSAPLKGRVLAQPSKSMAHRAILCAALAQGESRIDNIVLSDDIKATIGAVRALGVRVVIEESGVFPGRKCLLVASQGINRIEEKSIDCFESGSTARFIMPITRLVADEVVLTGHGRLVERPFGLYAELFRRKGIKYSDHDGKMPITLSGKLVPGEYALPGDVSSQFVSGLLFALPLLDGDSKIIVTSRLESLPYVQMTVQALKDFGVTIETDKDCQTFTIKGGQAYKPLSGYIVEGDWSQAAFFCVAAAVSENVEIVGLNPDSLQGDKVIAEILQRMGAEPCYRDGRLSFAKSRLTGIEADVSQCPDLVPAISVAASVAKGTTHITNAARLRIKESDRLMTTCRELSRLGARISEEPDGLIIEGVDHLPGGKAQGCGDHRIVMALAIASSLCAGCVEIEGSEAVAKSYPEFWQDFAALGGRFESL